MLENKQLNSFYGTQTRYNAVKTREIKRIYYIDNQLFAIFLYLVILPFLPVFC